MADGLSLHHYRADESLRLAYYTTPNRGLPVLSFIHGNGLSANTYWPMLSVLSTDFDLLMIDVQGHGDSEVGGDFRGWKGNATLINQLIVSELERQNRPKDTPVFGLGHSLGATLTGLIAKSQPTLFTRVCLLDPALFPWPMLLLMNLFYHTRLHHTIPVVKKAKRRRSEWPNKAQAYVWLRTRGVFKPWQETCFLAYLDSALTTLPDDRVMLSCPPWLEACVFASAPLSSWSGLRALPAGSGLLQGEQTDAFFTRAGRHAERQYPHVSRHTHPGDHCFMLEHPESVAAWVRDFLLDNARLKPA